MKTTQWDQQGRSGDFIVNLTKKYTFLGLDKWIPDESLLSESLLPKQAI